MVSSSTLMPTFNSSMLPNPFTPKAFLPPEIAYQIQIADYFCVGALGAYIWDILSNLHNDYRILCSKKLGLGTATYFFSRLWSFLFIFGTTFFQTYPLNSCRTALTLVDAAFAVAVPANCLLFFLRARAIFSRNTVFVVFLFLLWLSVAGSVVTVPFTIVGGNIGRTRYCLTVSSKPYVAASVIIPLLHDTVIFVAISWRLYLNAYVGERGLSLMEHVGAFFTGKYLPQFSRAILQDGQLYYLITVSSNLLTVVMFYNTKVAQTYSLMFTLSNMLLTNVLVCHVFRNTKLQRHESEIHTSELTLPQSAPIAFWSPPTGTTQTFSVDVARASGTEPRGPKGKEMPFDV